MKIIKKSDRGQFHKRPGVKQHQIVYGASLRTKRQQKEIFMKLLIDRFPRAKTFIRTVWARREKTGEKPDYIYEKIRVDLARRGGGKKFGST
ncbi:MAG: hypothetical protein KKD69_07445 [Euryarchaeota archaeon]|nr:hypothetical protein [Euryarchaeota archaeon]